MPESEPRKRFAIVSWDILTDLRLTLLDVRIYGVLAACRKGRKSEIGSRLIAKYVGASRNPVLAGIKRLAGAGYLEIAQSPRRRAVYTLTDPVFVKSGSVHESPDSAAIDPLSSTPTLHCPLCHDRCRGLLKVGWCRSCNWKKRVQKIVREELYERRIQVS